MWWKIPLFVFLGAVALLALLLLVPVYFRIVYIEKWSVTAYVLGIPVRLTRLPKRKGDKPQEPQKEQKKNEPPDLVKSVLDRFGEDGVKAVTAYVRRLAQIITSSIGRLFRSVTVTRCRIALLVAGADAAQTAQMVGWTCSAVYPALAIIEEHMPVRNRHVTVSPDFLASKSHVKLEIRFHAALITAAVLALQLYKQYQQAEDMIHPQKETENGK